jgi:hypothetical protein
LRRRQVCGFLTVKSGKPSAGQAVMADQQNEDMTVVPLPTSETESEHERVRSSNDRDQQAEREGKPSRHNRGYDEAADGTPAPQVENLIDEP